MDPRKRQTLQMLSLFMFLTGTCLSGAPAWARSALCPAVHRQSSGLMGKQESSSRHERPSQTSASPGFFSHLQKPAQPRQQVHLSKGKTTEPVEVLNFDLQMANESGLSVEEAVALRLNLNGATASAANARTFSFESERALTDASQVFKAYAQLLKTLKIRTNWGNEHFKLVSSMKENLGWMRSAPDSPPISPLGKGDFAVLLDFEVPDSIRARATQYGIEIRNLGLRTEIVHHTLTSKQALNQLSLDLNQMIAKKDPPERIASFLLQELTLLDPLPKGKAAAWLSAQALYKNLTGQDLVFPKAHQEALSHSVDDLARALSKPVEMDNSFPPNPLSAEEVIRMAYLHNPSVLPEMVRPDQVQSEAPRKDVPFPPEFFMGERKIRYAELENDVKRIDKTLFYGVPAKTMMEAERKAIAVMKFGRGSRDPNPHLDILRHMESTQGDSSGFFSTADTFAMGLYFAARKDFGVVFAIDPRGAEVLKIYDYIRGNYSVEREVAFGNRVNPARIQAAFIVDKNKNIVRILVNPAYEPQRTSTP